MPRRGIEPDEDEGAVPVALDTNPRPWTATIGTGSNQPFGARNGFPQPPNEQDYEVRSVNTNRISIQPESGIVGTRSIRLQVLERLPTYASYAPGGAELPQDVNRPKLGWQTSVASVDTTTSRSLAPLDLISLEAGQAAVFSQNPRDANGALLIAAKHDVAPIGRDDSKFFRERVEHFNMAIVENYSHSYDVSISNEVGTIGGAWRGLFKRIVIRLMDNISALQISRLMQFQLFFLTAYEAFLLEKVLESLDSDGKVLFSHCISNALKNRNVSRIIVNASNTRFDFFWHWSTAVTWNRSFDAWGQFPIVGITSFPGSENSPSTRNHALASMFRIFLGQGNWITRVITRGREGLITDNVKAVAQNLAAESNGFETANRNQYGTFIGRIKTNEFRFAHRLPVDESLVRTFISQPLPTMVNNGMVHMLRHLAIHWNNMLNQEFGNFAHQRMEQLDPFETLRFHMPRVLLVLSTFRGRNKWDADNLGPMMRRLQELRPTGSSEPCRILVRELKSSIVDYVCAGIPSIAQPFHDWLDAIDRALVGIEKEAQEVYKLVSTIELGIRLGYEILSRTNFKVPSDTELKNHILGRIKAMVGNGKDGKKGFDHAGKRMGEFQILVQRALNLLPPRDKRMLIELVREGLEGCKPARLLLSRVKTLLQREIRREALNKAITEASCGEYMDGKISRDEWYWMQGPDTLEAFIYVGQKRDRTHNFMHVESGVVTPFMERPASGGGGRAFLQLDPETRKTIEPEVELTLRVYVPVAEAISRAQRGFMYIELEHGQKYKYNGLMEFTYLRENLRKLVVVGAMNCSVLDSARLNILREIQRSDSLKIAPEEMELGTTYYVYNASNDSYDPFHCTKPIRPGDPEWKKLKPNRIVPVAPQSVLVVGGGPTGLMAAIHCAENCLASGGEMKLFESRDAFLEAGSSFERAQIVRLDARWIAMLRYHLGTVYEDVYVPASGETDSQLGNTLPTQGFVEITIKDLEAMLHIEVSRLWSKGLISVFTDSKAQFSASKGYLTKKGANLKKGDIIVRNVDENGNISKENHSWRVVELQFTKSIEENDLIPGQEYAIFLRNEGKVLPFQLLEVEPSTKVFTFLSMSRDVENLFVHASNLPSIYNAGTNTNAHSNVHTVVLESVKIGKDGGFVQDKILMENIADESFVLDVGRTHVAEAIGKLRSDEVVIPITTYEPYCVCCMQGLKVSMGMHNFGETRWGKGLLDDVRSHRDRNTRIVGDFTKMVRVVPITERMWRAMMEDEDWALQFKSVIAESSFPGLNSVTPVVSIIQEACLSLKNQAPSFVRQTLQTRFFETGDNFYLGMELPREYDKWKKELSTNLVSRLAADNSGTKTKIERLKSTLQHYIDRLWYEGCVETIRTGDVYNPGARRRVPRLYLIDSHVDSILGSLPIGESFRLSNNPKEKFEIVSYHRGDVVVRNVEGYVSRMAKSTRVRRQGNLTRGPDGNRESKVAMSSFPVAHYVNYRTMRILDKERGYAIVFMGDEQATPHFMRYSGLTGACINVMSFNVFLRNAIKGKPFVERFREYSKETNWSNSEVVTRGTGANFGLSFLRPGFSYSKVIDWLHSKLQEHKESEQSMVTFLSNDWKAKLAASIVPLGLENNDDYKRSLKLQWHQCVFERFLIDVKSDKRVSVVDLDQLLRGMHAAMVNDASSTGNFWDELLNLEFDEKSSMALNEGHIPDARRLDIVCSELIEFAEESRHYNKRISSELFNQPKPVDSIVDDFAVEAQSHANSLVLSAAYSSAAVALNLVSASAATVGSAVLSVINISISFSTIADVSRYKIRNEEARIIVKRERFLQIKKAVFRLMSSADRMNTPRNINPYITEVEDKVKAFRMSAIYYDEPPSEDLDSTLDLLLQEVMNVETVRSFQKELVLRIIPHVYHVNSYLQERLVALYRCLDDLAECLLYQPDETKTSDARHLFYRLEAFDPRLEASLQVGPVRWGFLKQRKLRDWDIVVVMRYFLRALCFSSICGSISAAPINLETLSILKEARRLSAAYDERVLQREIRDLEIFYWAARESEIASMIIVSSSLVFLASIVFTVGRIGAIGYLINSASWALVTSTIGATLAVFHFMRKLSILSGLYFRFFGRRVSTQSARSDLNAVRGVTLTQMLLTFLRLLASLAASVALPLALAESYFDDRTSVDRMIPVYIAGAAVAMAVGATILFFLVEYVVRYNLPVMLGPFICKIFLEDIMSIKSLMTPLPNKFDPIEVQEREAWEYTSRAFLHKYRFDTVFAADRFGQILQYIQSGMSDTIGSSAQSV